MLEKLRKPGRAKNLVAYVVFGAIIIVFVGFGVVPHDMGAGLGSSAAIVNGTPISIGEFQERAEREMQQYDAQLKGLPEAERREQSQRLRQQILERLIAYEVAYQAAVDRGLWATDQEVRDQIVRLPMLQEDGRFKRELYNRYLEAMRLTPANFETKIRKDIVVGRLEELFSGALRSSSLEKAFDKEVERTQLSLDVAGFSREEIMAKLKPSASELESFLSSQAERVKKAYEGDPARYATPEERRVRQILVKVDPAKQSDAKYRAQVQEQVKAVTDRLKSEDFATVAKSLSADPVTKAKGGELGWVRRGQLEPELEGQVFGLAVGQVSEAVLGSAGFHIFKVDEVKASQPRDLKLVEKEIATELWSQDQVDPWLTQLEKDLQAGKEDIVRRELKSKGLSWQDTGDFDLASENIPKLGEVQGLVEKVLERGARAGLLGELVRASGRYYVVSIKGLKRDVAPKGAFAGLSDFMAARRHIMAFNDWVKNERDTAKIQRNQRLFQ